MQLSGVRSHVVVIAGSASNYRWDKGKAKGFSSCTTVSCPQLPYLHIITVSPRNVHGPSDSDVAFSCSKGHPGGNQVDGLPPALSDS